MDINSIIQSMKQSGVPDHAAETLGFAISSMSDKGMSPYLLAMCCVQAGSATVIKTLPDSELKRYGEFLQRSGDIKIRGALTNMSIKSEQGNQNFTTPD